jgi:hypothetical protein
MESLRSPAQRFERMEDLAHGQGREAEARLIEGRRRGLPNSARANASLCSYRLMMFPR